MENLKTACRSTVKLKVPGEGRSAPPHVITFH